MNLPLADVVHIPLRVEGSSYRAIRVAARWEP